MLMKILSYARKSGSWQGRNYDSLILYTLTIKSTFDTVNSVLSGHPVEFHELKIPISRFNSVFAGSPCTFDFLDSIIGKNADISFALARFNGVDKMSVESVKVLGGDE